PRAPQPGPRSRGDDRDRERGEDRRERRGTRVVTAQPEPDRNRHRPEERRGREGEQDRGHATPGRRTRRASTSAAAGWASRIPAMITAHPRTPTTPSVSPASVIPKNAAHTGSSENASAVRVALVRRCAHVCARNASALAKTPVTSSAPHTVQPCGT